MTGCGVRGARDEHRAGRRAHSINIKEMDAGVHYSGKLIAHS